MKRLLLLAICCMLCFACTKNPYDPEVMHANYVEGRTAYEAGDYNKAFAVLKPLALKGHAHAQYYAALMNYQGQGTVPYPHEGAVLLYNASQQGQAEAMYTLALAYDQGKGVMPNQERSLYWMSKSAEAVYMSMQGWNYNVIPANGQAYPITLYWFQQNEPQADDYALLFTVAQRYFMGLGMEQHDWPKAAAMYRQLALGDNPYQADSQYALGVIYYTGDEVLAQDIAQARGWLMLAADRGHEQAASSLQALNAAYPPAAEDLEFDRQSLLITAEQAKAQQDAEVIARDIQLAFDPEDMIDPGPGGE